MIAIKLKGLSVTELMTPVKTLKATDSVSHAVSFLMESGLYDAFIEGDGEEEVETFIVSIRDLLNVSDVSTKVSSIMHRIPRLNANNTIG